LDKSVSVGIHVPSVAVAGLQSGLDYTEFFRDVETCGFDATWVEDRIFHPNPLADSLLLLSWAAANTCRLLLGTAVLMLNIRFAPIVARQISTLNHGEIFYTLKEAQIIIEKWRKHYNTKRPHSALGYRPAGPEAIVSMDQKPVVH
jgi:transposase InsO family protein